jgi:periplasmic protein TonB
MKSSIKVRSRNTAAVTPRVEDGPGVNDNVPAMLPGHQLSDLEGVPRQPAAESVIYYSRVTLIESYPAPPKHDPKLKAEAPPMEETRERRMAAPRAGRKHATVAGLCSFLMHAAVFAAILATFVVTPEEPAEEAGDVVSVIMLGNSDLDQQAAGDDEKQPEPEPEKVIADAVQPDTVQPTEAEPEPAQPVEPQQAVAPTETAEAVQPTEVQPQEAQPVQPDVQPVSPQPEVLATTAPAETTVVQPVTQAPEPVQPEAQPSEVRPAETAAVQPEAQPPEQVATPIAKPPAPKPPAEKPKQVVRKEPPKKAKVKAGSEGQSAQDSKKGASDGTESAQSNQNSQSAGNRNGQGTAEEANYLGKVSARLARCVRRLPSEYRQSGGSLRVRLVSDANGNVISANIARGSGMAEVDGKVAGLVKSCSLPSLPSGWGQPTRTLTQEVQIAR